MRANRLLLALTIFSASLTPGFSPAQAHAPQASAPAARTPLPPCGGTVNIFRMSEIKPGMMQKFLDASAAQQAWYKAAGATDEFYVMRVMVQDPTTKAWAYSETEAITTHTLSVDRGVVPPHDAAWNDFVAALTASSSIKAEYITCSTKM